MKVKDFSYKLPEHLIAQSPLKERTASRLLVVDKKTGETVDTHFERFIDYLEPRDVLVLNDTAVLPARLIGTKQATGAIIEVLLLNQAVDDVWACLVKKARKIREGTVIVFGHGLLKAECVGVKDEGIRMFKMHYDGVFYEILDVLGDMPLPPYIHEKLIEKDRYQTVYRAHKGSAAAPTAGLHFTEAYLEKLIQKNITLVFVTLHVGLGTFRPVSVKHVEDHTMHAEYYVVSAHVAETINHAKREHRRVIAVGTTSLRTLETVSDETGIVSATSGFSEIFIYPGYRFKCVDALLTNFHLPESTLLMLVSAFSSQKIIFDAYEHAIQNQYRFFSFGDAMFLTNHIKK